MWRPRTSARSRDQSSGRHCDTTARPSPMGEPTLSRERVSEPLKTSLSKAKKHLARVRDDERPWVAGELVEVDVRRVEIVEVDPAGDVLGDPGGQGHRDPVDLAELGVVGPGTAEVRRVGEVAPVIAGEPVPLGEEVVAAVIADLLDGRMCLGDL